MDCSFSASYSEDMYLGYPANEHYHSSNHGTVNYHMPESGEYYILMITNYSRQPCVISFSQTGGTGSSGCYGQKNITAGVNSVEGGTVTGAGEYECGSSCTLTATANEGFVFMDWTDENGVVVSTDEEYTFTVWGNRNFTANFVEGSAACYLIFSLNDSNGNGWSDNYLVLNFEDGPSQKLTIPYDSSLSSYSLPIVDGSHISLGWISGLYTEQCSFSVSYSNGNMICYGNELNNNYEFEFDIDCISMPVSTFYITASANPLGGGIVSGIGEYECGSTCTLTATANEGYTFMYWIENGQQVSSNDTCSFVVTSEHNMVAVFAPFSITAVANPIEGGTVSGMGEYENGSTCTLTATANEGYTFLYWTENGQQVSSNVAYSFTVTSERDLVAHFTLPFSITATANPIEGGMVSGTGDYNYGSTCTLTAIANEGYTFIYWTENGQQISSNANYTFTVTSERDLVAHFVLPFSITATANPVEGGMVSGTGEYDYGSTCTLTAVANEGYTFMYWTENGQQISSNANYTFTVTSERDLVAHFALPFSITATANPEEGGTVTGSGEYDYYSTCIMTATPNPGYYFVKWTENGQQVSTNISYSFIVTRHRNLVAVFSPYCHVQTSVNPNEGGTVYYDNVFGFENGMPSDWTTIDADGDGLTWVSSMTPGIYHNSGVNLSGTGHNASEAYVISCSYANQTGQVLYPDNYLVSPQIALGGSISFYACAQDNCYAAEHFGVAVSTTSNTSASAFTMLQEWTMTAKGGGNGVRSFGRDGDNRGQGNWYQFTVDLSSYSGMGYVAIRHFNCHDQFILNVDDITIAGFSVEEGEYCQGQTCYLNAIPNDGYNFINWTEDGEVVSTEPAYSFTVTGDRNLVANFYTNHWTASESFQNNMFMLGVVQIDGVEQMSPTLELGAFCNGECRGAEFPIYEEGRWLYFMAIGGNSGDDITFRLYDHALQQELDLYCYNILSFEESVFIGVDNPYEVQFASTFTISADINPIEGGSVIGTGDYAPGMSATLVATPNEGYAFNCWTFDGEVVSTEPSYTFTVTESMNFTANFDVMLLQQLSAGWNWFSTYLEITLDDLKAALLAAFPNVGANALVIKSKSGQTSWNPLAQRWVGSLNTIDLSQMYMIKVPTDIVITLQGVPINPADHPVTIKNGVNWIAFPSSESMSVTNAFAGFAVNGDMVKSKANGVAAYYGTIWAGALKNLVPGQGYIYKSNVQDDRTFTFPISTR